MGSSVKKSSTASSLSWYNNQASPEKEKPVSLIIHTARANIHPNALYTFSISFPSKNGKEEWALAVHHLGGNLGITEQTTKLEQMKLYHFPFHKGLYVRAERCPSWLWAPWLICRNGRGVLWQCWAELISCARRPRGLSASGWYWLRDLRTMLQCSP